MVSVRAEEVEPFIQRIVQESGASLDVARQVSRSLVEASLRGHNSHGIRRAKIYYDWSQDTSHNTFPLDPSADPVIRSAGGSTAVVDGQNAYGQVVGRLATDEAVERAHEHGVGVVGIRDAAHLGRIGEWAERAAEDGMLFCAFVNTQGGKWIAPPGSAQRRYSTNPISFGVPTFAALPFPIVLDIATSQVSNGKFRELVSTGESARREWSIDDGGESVTDPTEYLNGQGAGLPLGGRTSGYKGFGLAMICELFAAIAGDGRVVGQTGDKKYGNAAQFIAIDPLVFTTREHITSCLTSMHKYIESTDFNPNIPTGATAYGDQAYLPGEPEYLLTQKRSSEGIPLPDEDVQSLVNLAVKLGLSSAVPTAFESFLSSND